MNVKQIYFKHVITLFLFSFLIFSCEKNESSSELEKANFEKEVIESNEFKSYVDAFSIVQNIDNDILVKFEEAEKKGIVNKQDLNNYFLNIINTNKKEETVSFLDKIGIKSSNDILDKRNSTFQKEIQNATIKLGEKFPNLKTYSGAEFEKLVLNSKKLKDEK